MNLAKPLFSLKLTLKVDITKSAYKKVTNGKLHLRPNLAYTNGLLCQWAYPKHPVPSCESCILFFDPTLVYLLWSTLTIFLSLANLSKIIAPILEPFYKLL